MSMTLAPITRKRAQLDTLSLQISAHDLTISARPSGSCILKGMRVLIVEDDFAARQGLAELVRAWGYVAEVATDGEEALSKLASFRPSVILADLVMPRMTGLELLDRLAG